AGLADYVVFSNGLVPFSEMPCYVASAELAALPFRDNAINRGKSSLTLLECMASGVPVVTHDVGDIGWMLGQGGELAHLDDPRDFGQRMAVLLSHPERRQQLGAAGRSRAELLFGWGGSVDYLEKAYHFAINRRRPRAA
ncbi:MAG: glycosyltransferase, partial [Polyangiales bacterium]